MGIIGTPQEARDAYHFGHGYEPEEGAPHDWKYLASGMFRNAFLSPSGVVYKVDKDEDLGYGQNNYGEYKNWLEAARLRLPEDCRLPAMTFYNIETGERDYYGNATLRGVMAMEYIKGGIVLRRDYDTRSRFNTLRRKLQNIGFSDVHDENVMVDPTSGKFVVVDIGATIYS